MSQKRLAITGSLVRLSQLNHQKDRILSSSHQKSPLKIQQPRSPIRRSGPPMRPVRCTPPSPLSITTLSHTRDFNLGDLRYPYYLQSRIRTQLSAVWGFGKQMRREPVALQMSVLGRHYILRCVQKSWHQRGLQKAYCLQEGQKTYSQLLGKVETQTLTINGVLPDRKTQTSKSSRDQPPNNPTTSPLIMRWRETSRAASLWMDSELPSYIANLSTITPKPPVAEPHLPLEHPTLATLSEQKTATFDKTPSYDPIISSIPPA